MTRAATLEIPTAGRWHESIALAAAAQYKKSQKLLGKGTWVYSAEAVGRERSHSLQVQAKKQSPTFYLAVN